MTKVPPMCAEFARTGLWLLTGTRAPGAEEGRCSPECSFFPIIFIFIKKNVLQELVETVSHKYLKITFQAPLKWTCLILQDSERRILFFFPFFSCFFQCCKPHWPDFVFFFFFFLNLVTTLRPEGQIPVFQSGTCVFMLPASGA